MLQNPDQQRDNIEPNTTQHLVIVGGGITGLSAAWTAQQAGIRCTVLEASDRWGGKIQTDWVEGYGDAPFIVEAGPDSFIAQKPWAAELAREIGLGDALLGTNDDKRKTYVLNRGKLAPLPDGVLLIVPTRFMPFALSTLISPLGKLRMGLEMFVPARTDAEDESLAGFVRRRLGNEALDKLAEPLMSGIYNTDPENQSLLGTFPRFRDMERKYGSLTRGMLAARRSRPPMPSGKKSSTFVSFKEGMYSLIDGLLNVLEADLRLNTAVEGIQHSDPGYTLTLSDGSTLAADAVILATPATVTSDLLCDMVPEAARLLGETDYVSTGTLSLAYKAEDLSMVPESFGVVIPRSEARAINAVTISSTKFDYRAPEGYALLRTFFGGSRSPQTVRLSDDDLLAAVQAELQQIYGITADPIFTRAYRWREATPQYGVGHLDRMTLLEKALPPGLFATGSAFRGIGVPDCVKQGRDTARKAVEILQAAPVHA